MAAAAKKADETPAADAPEASNLPAVAGGSNLPAHLQGMMEADAGAGVSTAADDNIVPLLYVLQSNSPQVNQRGADAVKGAKPGDLWIKGSDVAIDGAEGMVVQPCAFRKDWVEWVPRSAGGGYVGRHDKCPADAVEKVDPESGRKKMVLPNGNEINETRYHYVIYEGAPLVIPFSPTGHTTSRDWMHKMNGVRMPNKQTAPTFATTWKLTTRERTNKAGSWFAVSAGDQDWVADAADYELGKSFNGQVESGEVKADAEDAAQNSGGGGGGGGETVDPSTGEIKGGKVPF